MDLTKNCILSCKSSWEALRYRSYEVDWDKLVWDAVIMPKHAFICWLAIRDRLSTFVYAETSGNPGIIFSLNVPFQAGCGSK